MLRPVFIQRFFADVRNFFEEIDRRALIPAASRRPERVKERLGMLLMIAITHVPTRPALIYTRAHASQCSNEYSDIFTDHATLAHTHIFVSAQMTLVAFYHI